MKFLDRNLDKNRLVGLDDGILKIEFFMRSLDGQ